jgi:hypothetical protein
MTKYSIPLSTLQANIEAICCRAICLYNMAVCLLKTYAGMRNLSVILRIKFLAPILLNNYVQYNLPPISIPLPDGRNRDTPFLPVIKVYV